MGVGVGVGCEWVAASECGVLALVGIVIVEKAPGCGCAVWVSLGRLLPMLAAKKKCQIGPTEIGQLLACLL